MLAWLSRYPAVLGVSIAVLVAVVGGVVFAAGFDEFCLDDAYIHLAYAKSLRLGDGFSYNPGDWQTGFSSPLWVALLALLPAPSLVGDQPWLLVELLGIALHAATAALAALLAVAVAETGCNRPKGADLAMAGGVAAVLAGLHPLLLKASTSGMEVSLAAFLLALASWAVVRERAGLGFGAALLAQWARPEALFFVAVLSVVVAVATRRKAALLPLGGSIIAFLAWVTYCQVVSGYPLPNTYYAKQGGALADGLWYLLRRIVPEEPWLVGVGGVVIAAIGLGRAVARRHFIGLALALAWLATLLAIAATRQLNPNILFYCSRYFTIVAFIPAVLVGAAVAAVSPRWRVLLVPVVAVLVWKLPATYSRTIDQRQDIRRLHTEPARYAATELPGDAVILVEGAGTLRYFAPRSMAIIDFFGLADRALVHAPDDASRYCELLTRRISHMAVPDSLRRPLTQLYRVRQLETFVEDSYSQSIQSYRRSVWFFAIDRPDPRAARVCALLAKKRSLPPRR